MYEKLIYAKIFQFLTLSEGGSYSSIFKILTAEVYGDYSTLIISFIGILDSQNHHH
jgi:hypothetical protein